VDFRPNTFDYAEGFREPADVLRRFDLPNRCPEHHAAGNAIRLWTPERVNFWTEIRQATITYECGCRREAIIDRDSGRIMMAAK
jgi:hypothetical protein